MPVRPKKRPRRRLADLRDLATERLKRRSTSTLGIAAVQGRRVGLLPRVLLGALSGVTVFLAFPEAGLHPLIWVALVPLFLALHGVRRSWHGLVIGWAAGTVTNLGGFYWLHYTIEEFGHLPPAVAWAATVLMALSQGLVFAAFSWMYVRLYRTGLLFRLVSVPALMVLAEAAVPYLFPWYLGNGIQPQVVVHQVAEVLGVRGASGLVAMVNGLLALAAYRAAVQRKVPAGSLAAAAVVLGGAWGWGQLRLDAVEAAMASAPRLKVAMVEADVGIWEKEAHHLDSAARRTMAGKSPLSKRTLGPPYGMCGV